MLVSWAVPKGPPPDGATNHLAVQTEDHPMEYAQFAGDIPHGEYGGGTVSIWDAGSYRLHKWRDGKEVIATLYGRPGGGLDGVAKFALIHTGGRSGRADRSWLMHRMETDPEDLAAASPTPPGPAPMPAEVTPMRASPGTAARVDDEGWSYEMDWDGERVVSHLASGRAVLVGADGTDRSAAYPQIRDALVGWAAPGSPPADGAVLDGVVVAGTHLFVFDLLRLGRRSLLRDPYAERRRELEDLIDPASTGPTVQVPPVFDGDLQAALQAATDLGLAGVVAKRRTSTYQPGRQARTWLTVRG